MQNSLLEIKDLTVEFDDFKLEDVNLSIDKGEYFVLLGESGAGKSVLLETIAGMIKPLKGQIFLNSKEITNQKIHKRKVGIVFQDYAVFPNMNVLKNIAYSLKKVNLSKSKKKQRVSECAGLMNISNLLNRMPATLSGGELQRVAMARMMASEPECLLFDEPLSAVDVNLKDEIRMLLRKINRSGQTIIHVTHSYNEAISLANRIAIVETGKIVQIGTPAEIFTNPASKFTANLSGTKNFFKAKITDQKNALTENKINIRVMCDKTGSVGYISFRSEDIVISTHALDSSLTNQFEGQIIDIIPGIDGIEIVGDIGIKLHAKISFKSFKGMDLEVGKKIFLSFKATAVKFISG